MKIFIANIKEADHPFRYIFFWFKQAFISFIPLKLIKKRQSRRYSFMARQYHVLRFKHLFQFYNDIAWI